MARTEASRSKGFTLGQLDPFQPIFRILTSVRFALWLIAFLAAGALLGVIFPQMPDFVRESELQRQRWLAEEAARYGSFTGLMDALQLFEVFRSYWFNAGLLVLLVSVSICTANRFPPIWRSIRRPPRQVNDQYFERAHHRAVFTTPEDPEALVRVLQRKRYKVERTVRDGITYLYADRFSWAQLGTFATHLALLIFIAGGLVTWRLGYGEDVLIAEGTTQPVLDVRSPDHMQVEVTNFVRRTDDQGRDLEYRTELVIYQNGREVAQGSSTVNDPFEYNGYRFHQAAFTEDGAALTVRDAESGRTLYREVLRLSEVLPAPLVTVQDAEGNTLYSDHVMPTSFPSDEVSAAMVTLDGREERLWIGIRRQPEAERENAQGPPWVLGVLRQDGGFRQIPFGASETVGEYTVTFASLSAANYRVVEGIPGAAEGQVLVEMVAGADGEARMALVGLGDEPVELRPGRPVTVGDRVYEFGGPRAFSGLTVRKDPGADFIWVATGLMMVGLGMTFYLPRRRLWAKITEGKTYLAGIADRTAKFGEELRKIGAEAGSPDALEPDRPPDSSDQGVGGTEDTEETPQ